MSQCPQDQYPWLTPLELPVAVKVMSTTRFGGASQTPFDAFNLGIHVGDETQAVSENRLFLRANLPGEPLWLDQVHGCRVVDADHIDPAQTLEADAAVTSSRAVVLAVQTADCMPVVIHAQGQVLGVAHAGWRGLAQGVLGALVGAMQKKLPAKTKDLSQWQAWIGPCIGPGAFQVGEEVREAFIAKAPDHQVYFESDPTEPNKWRCDLPGLALRELQNMGIAQAKWCGLCTVTDEQGRFFSYRRDGRTGRMATVAWLG